MARFGAAPGLGWRRVRLLAVLGLLAGLALTTLLVLTPRRRARSGTAFHGAGLGRVRDPDRLSFGADHGADGRGVVALWGSGQPAWPYFAWGRLIRDSAGETLPLIATRRLCPGRAGHRLGRCVQRIRRRFDGGRRERGVGGAAWLHADWPGATARSAAGQSFWSGPLLAGVAIMAALVAGLRGGAGPGRRGCGADQRPGRRRGVGAADRRVRRRAGGDPADPPPWMGLARILWHPFDDLGAERGRDLGDAAPDGRPGIADGGSGDR